MHYTCTTTSNNKHYYYKQTNPLSPKIRAKRSNVKDNFLECKPSKSALQLFQKHKIQELESKLESHLKGMQFLQQTKINELNQTIEKLNKDNYNQSSLTENLILKCKKEKEELQQKINDINSILITLREKYDNTVVEYKELLARQQQESQQLESEYTKQKNYLLDQIKQIETISGTKLKETEQKYVELNKQYLQLKQELTTKQVEEIEHIKQIDEFKLRESATQNQIQLLQSTIVTLENTIKTNQDAEKQVKEQIENQLESWKEKCKSKEIELQEKLMKYSVLEDQYISLKNKLEFIEQKEKEFVKQTIADKDAVLKTFQDKENKFHDTLQTKLKLIDDLNLKLVTIEEEKNGLSLKVQELLKSRPLSNDQINARDKQVAKQLKQYRDKLASYESWINVEKPKLENQLKLAMDQIKQFKDEITFQTSYIESLKLKNTPDSHEELEKSEKLRKRGEQIGDLYKKQSEMRKTNLKELNTLQNALSQKEKQYESLLGSMNSLKEQLTNSLNKKEQQLQLTVNELSKMKEYVNNIEVQRDNLTTKIAELQKELSSHPLSNDQINARDKRLAKQLKEYRDKLASYESWINVEKPKLETQLKDALEKVNEYVNEVNSQSNYIKLLKEDKAGLSNQLKDIKDTVNKRGEKIAKCIQEQRELKQEHLIALKQLKDSNLSELNQLKVNEMQKYKQYKDQQEQQEKEHQSMIKELQEQISKLSSESTNEKMHLQEKLDLLRKEHQDYKQEVSVLIKQLEDNTNSLNMSIKEKVDTIKEIENTEKKHSQEIINLMNQLNEEKKKVQQLDTELINERSNNFQLCFKDLNEGTKCVYSIIDKYPEAIALRVYNNQIESMLFDIEGQTIERKFPNPIPVDINAEINTDSTRILPLVAALPSNRKIYEIQPLKEHIKELEEELHQIKLSSSQNTKPYLESEETAIHVLNEIKVKYPNLFLIRKEDIKEDNDTLPLTLPLTTRINNLLTSIENTNRADTTYSKDLPESIKQDCSTFIKDTFSKNGINYFQNRISLGAKVKDICYEAVQYIKHKPQIVALIDKLLKMNVSDKTDKMKLTNKQVISHINVCKQIIDLVGYRKLKEEFYTNLDKNQEKDKLNTKLYNKGDHSKDIFEGRRHTIKTCNDFAKGLQRNLE